jgi:hypothetical protein
VDDFTLIAAVEDLYRKARTEGLTTSTKRLDVLARYCVGELAHRGLLGVRIEPQIPGFARTKSWDVAWFHREKVRLAISLKSILTNLGGTVPNRTDDLMGEAANLQMYSPEVVIGYLMVFNVEGDQSITKHGCTWFELLAKRLDSLSGRRPPHWTLGTVEATALVKVDFRMGPLLLSGETEVSAFFDTMVEEVLRRNPDITQESGTA